LTFEGETIGEVVYSINPDDIVCHVWTRAASNSFADALRVIWRRIFPRAELQGLFEYVTVGPSQGGKHELRSTKAHNMPDVGLADSWGAAGLSSQLPAGTRVLVAFANQDPSKPVLLAMDPGVTPTTTSLSATVDVKLGLGTFSAVANTPNFIAWIAALTAATGVPGPAAYTSTKVKV
jgi:hypothetical protein